jgi:hypothetical protein
LKRPRSGVLNPACTPQSRSACCTHLRSASGGQPIFPAIDLTAAQRELCSTSFEHHAHRALPELDRVRISGSHDSNSPKKWSLRKSRGASEAPKAVVLAPTARAR